MAGEAEGGGVPLLHVNNALPFPASLNYFGLIPKIILLSHSPKVIQLLSSSSKYPSMLPYISPTFSLSVLYSMKFKYDLK